MAAGFGGARVRNRIDAAIFRIWVKRSLLAIAIVLLVQSSYDAWHR
jgi:hypothetical protein